MERWLADVYKPEANEKRQSRAVIRKRKLADDEMRPLTTPMAPPPAAPPKLTGPFDTDLIRPGMSKEEAKWALREIAAEMPK
jgi:hypothetical protein